MKFCCLALHLGAVTATVMAAGSPLAGVWRGTIGDQSVMVCLDPANETSSYYYPRYLKGLALQATSTTAGTWVEKSQGKTSGEWQLTVADTNHLTGVWTSAPSQRAAPIRLVRLASPRESNPCESASYNAQRLDAARLTAGKVAMLGRKRYQTISTLDGDLISVQLLESGTRYPSINRQLREDLHHDVIGYYACHTMMTAAARDFADYQTRIDPVFWNDRWLTLGQSLSDFCGGAHPNNDYHYQNWNLKTGEKTDLWSWFKTKTVTPQLNRVIVAYAQPIAECKAVLAENTDYSVRPSANGLMFYPQLAHGVQACADNILVPYRKLVPFLNASGKAEVENLLRSF